MLAYTYPLADLFGTMLGFFVLVIWIWLLIIVFSDIFRSQRPEWRGQDVLGALRDHPALPRDLRVSDRPRRQDARARCSPGSATTGGLRRGT